MHSEDIIGFVIYLLVAFFMIGIGICQVKSKNPVGFYSGEKPFKKEELSDVYLWNKKHGWMWICYGIIILLSYGIGFIIGIDSVMCVIPMCGGIIIPIPVMIWKHHRLIKEMKIK